MFSQYTLRTLRYQSHHPSGRMNKNQLKEAEQFIKLIELTTSATKKQKHVEEHGRYRKRTSNTLSKSSKEDKFFVILASILGCMYLFLLITGHEDLIDREISIFMTSKSVIEGELGKILNGKKQQDKQGSGAKKNTKNEPEIIYELRNAHFDPSIITKEIMAALAELKTNGIEPETNTSDNQNHQHQQELEELLAKINVQEDHNSAMIEALKKKKKKAKRAATIPPSKDGRFMGSIEQLKEFLIPSTKINNIPRLLANRRLFQEDVNSRYSQLIQESLKWELSEQLLKIKTKTKNTPLTRALELHKFYTAAKDQLIQLESMISAQIKEEYQFLALQEHAENYSKSIEKQIELFNKFLIDKMAKLKETLAAHNTTIFSSSSSTITQPLQNLNPTLQTFFTQFYALL